MSQDVDLFPVRLRYIRKLRKLTQEQLGEKINVTKVSISGYEMGSRTPDMFTLSKLSSALNCSVDYLLGKSETPELTQNEEMLWNDLEKPIEEIMKKYNLVYEGQTVSEDEIEELLIYLKTKRLMMARKNLSR